MNKIVTGIGVGFVAFLALMGAIGYFYGPPSLRKEIAQAAAPQQQPQQQQQQQQQQQPPQGNQSCQEKGQALDQAIQASHDAFSHDQHMREPSTALKAMELGMALRAVGPCADANGNLPQP